MRMRRAWVQHAHAACPCPLSCMTAARPLPESAGAQPLRRACSLGVRACKVTMCSSPSHAGGVCARYKAPVRCPVLQTLECNNLRKKKVNPCVHPSRSWRRRWTAPSRPGRRSSAARATAAAARSRRRCRRSTGSSPPRCRRARAFPPALGARRQPFQCVFWVGVMGSQPARPAA